MYTVQFTEPAEDDVFSVLNYISKHLKAPEAAKRLLDEIEEKTELLTSAPLSYALVLDDYLSSKGLRSILIKNYLLFYIVNQKENTVSVIRFLYARRNWAYLLSNPE